MPTFCKNKQKYRERFFDSWCNIILVFFRIFVERRPTCVSSNGDQQAWALSGKKISARMVAVPFFL